MAVSKRLRYEILRRDNHACRHCGATAPDVKLTVDHVTPTALGGSDDPSNLVAACAECNSGKSATPPGAPLVADVKEDDLRWAAAMWRAGVEQREDLELELELGDTVSELWATWENYFDAEYRRPLDWRQSIRSMKLGGARHTLLTYAVNTAVLSKAVPDAKWRYFCGVVWRALTERQEKAREILASEAP